jgi:SnoaL-like polyketide cyclase
MSTVIETAKSATIAYNEKNWDKVKAVVAGNCVYDEKATGRRAEGVGKMIEVWQGWAKAIPDSKATFVSEHVSGDTAVIEVVWKGVHTGPLQTATGTIPPSNKRIEVPACQVIKVEGGPCSRRSARSRGKNGRSGYCAVERRAAVILRLTRTTAELGRERCGVAGAREMRSVRAVDERSPS